MYQDDRSLNAYDQYFRLCCRGIFAPLGGLVGLFGPLCSLVVQLLLLPIIWFIAIFMLSFLTSFYLDILLLTALDLFLPVSKPRRVIQNPDMVGLPVSFAKL